MYIKNIYANIPRFIVVICIKVGLFIFTTACSRSSLSYNMHTNRKNIDATQTDQGTAFPTYFDLLQVDENGMTPFCKAIAELDYKKLKDLLKELGALGRTIPDDVIYLITGYKINKEGNKKYPKKALLAQVITSHEGELLESIHTEELLDILFGIVRNHTFDLEQAFLQKHGADEETIMGLAVGTASVAIVKCLAGWYLKKEGSIDLCGLMRVCSMPNHSGTTPLSRIAKAMYRPPLRCGKHGYDRGCETCDHAIEMRIRREDIVLYLLALGVPIGTLLHDVVKHDAGDFLIEIMAAIQKRTINRYTPEDLVFLKDIKGNSLLFYAVLYRDYKLAEYLLALGACPMQFNQNGICPTFLAVGFRDIKMVKCLSKAKCILDRICNINKQNSNGITILDVARSLDGRGICPYLASYCNNFAEKYGRQIVHNGWDWKPNHLIAQLVSDLCNYFSVPVKKRKRSNLYYHAKLDGNRQSHKRKHPDPNPNPGKRASPFIGPSKRQKIASKADSPSRLFSPIGLASFSSGCNVFGGG